MQLRLAMSETMQEKNQPKWMLQLAKMFYKEGKYGPKGALKEEYDKVMKRHGVLYDQVELKSLGASGARARAYLVRPLHARLRWALRVREVRRDPAAERAATRRESIHLNPDRCAPLRALLARCPNSGELREFL